MKSISFVSRPTADPLTSLPAVGRAAAIVTSVVVVLTLVTEEVPSPVAGSSVSIEVPVECSPDVSRLPASAVIAASIDFTSEKT